MPKRAPSSIPLASGQALSRKLHDGRTARAWTYGQLARRAGAVRPGSGVSAESARSLENSPVRISPQIAIRIEAVADALEFAVEQKVEIFCMALGILPRSR
jgi:hypothetical protein